MAKDKARSAEEALEAAQAAVEDALDAAHRYLKHEWRDRPVTVALAALGAGVLIGLLLGGRR